MAVRGSREIVIEASPAAILNALADVSALPSWSSMYQSAEVLDRYDDGRPRHVFVAVKVLGRLDEEVLEYHWGPNCLVWDAEQTRHQYAQHVEFTLQPAHDGSTTLVRIDVTVEPATLIPDFMIRKVRETVLRAATEGLRDHLLDS